MFLSLRARELCPGGRLVIVLPALADDGSAGFEQIFQQANTALAEMAAVGEITAEERSRMVIGAYPRRKRDLLAPFATNEKFQQLTIENCEVFELPDAAWTDYQHDGDKEALTSKHALFFRSIFVPSLASALDRVREGDSKAVATFSNRIEQRLKQRLASQPAPMHSFVQTIVLAKAKEH